MLWYYAKDGVQMGPVPREELEAAIRSGVVNAQDLVWREGMPTWIPCGQTGEFGVLATPPALGSAPLSPAPLTRPAQGAFTPRIPNYLWQAIVVTVLCCWPFGIPAIVYASKVDDLSARGDIPGAMAASRNARTWCWVAVLLWVVPAVLALLWFLFIFAAVGAVATSA